MTRHAFATQETSAETENALRQVIANYQRFVNAGDAQGYATQFTDDIVWMPPNAPDRVGPSEVFTAQGATLSQVKLNVELTPTEARALSDDFGFVLVSVRGTATPHAGGDSMDIRFRAMFLMAHQPDGSWKIARQMWNNKPAEAA